ncbi:putative DsbA family dithiol-disulfide isomerase [Micromonospora pisi]|uniref:Putative DsbA family dithiol-disulfide isomerase n=1 Tax=Micromonospora pisi TaxID=589240 RepID=A0A495JJZ6_9ACTN|nr:DsbA family oxidoreductase [Micromonospora pisi]RKR89243.1 putative DsbA family dithiol-disulfide isomerase [Micromonospora pisi]
MEIDLYADVVCPWCYIGKRRLEQALQSYDGEVTVRLRPFQLDPSPVPEPVPMMEALGAKFGGPQRARQMVDHVTGIVAATGLDYQYDRAVAANTFEAHRLVWFAEQRGLGSRMMDALQRAHFVNGVDIGSRSALAGLAAGVGLDETEVREWLDSDAGTSEVRAELAEAHALGVTSVPTYVLAGKYAVVGAQETETLLQALAEVTRLEASA